MSIGFWLFLWIVAGWALLFGWLSRGGVPARSGASAAAFSASSGLGGAAPQPRAAEHPAPAPAVRPSSPSPSPVPPAAPAAMAAAPAPGDEAVGDEHKPELLAAPRGEPDDLELIWGVGPKLAELLNQLGVYHFSQIASWTEMNLKWIDQNLGSFKGRAVRDQWIEQSVKLASGWRPENKIGDRPQA